MAMLRLRWRRISVIVAALLFATVNRATIVIAAVGVVGIAVAFASVVSLVWADPAPEPAAVAQKPPPDAG
ncbi:MAG: hypothetical protein M0R73_10595 [Dehalococcoidia bacterium]|nr:hypothetical protein [Dehalococcoidia bacterium]